MQPRRNLLALGCGNHTMVVVMGSPAARAVLGSIPGINRIRGQWQDWRGRPVLPMNHPAALLRDGTLKRVAWAWAGSHTYTASSAACRAWASCTAAAQLG